MKELEDENSVYCFVDNVRYTIKPLEGGVGNIIKNILSKEHFKASLSMEELASYMGNAHAIIPCKLKIYSNKKENFVKTNLIIIDIDNKDEQIEKYGYITINSIKDEPFIKDNCSFIQKSISYTEELNKFKLVFRTNRDITSLDEMEKIYSYFIRKYPFADTSVQSSTRIFFGGIGVDEIDYSNTLTIDDIDLSNIELKRHDSTDDEIINNNALPNGQSEFIDLLKEDNETKVKEALLKQKKNQKKTTNYDELLSIIQSINLHDLLDCPKGLFLDLFHVEENPSSNIYKDDKGIYHYKCFSESENGNNLDLVGIIAKVKEIHRMDAFFYLVWQLELLPDEFNLAKKSIIHHLEEIDNDNSRYINANKIFGKKTKEFMEVIEILFNNLSIVDKKIVSFSRMSGNLMSKKMNEQDETYRHNKYAKFLSFCSFFGFIKKCEDSEIPKVLLGEVEKKKKENNFVHRDNVYQLCVLNDSFFENLEEKCKKMVDAGFVYSSFTYKVLIRIFSEEEVCKHFPQEKIRHDSEVEIEARRYIGEIINEYGTCGGVISEAKIGLELKNYIDWSDGKIKNFLKDNRVVIQKENNLEFQRMTKQNKRFYHVEGGFGKNIYTPRVSLDFKNLALKLMDNIPSLHSFLEIENGKIREKDVV
ncbi:hypothetical protein ACWOFR_09725 [Carnobacterium gallinarum]|uniref:hypothetical protein n=1 Tax=Carnobacterium gallinarum TaxID=2749 RepID=UPI00054EEB05|nr:hypothetical protein [Carnobacterium gallinarum]